MLSVLILLDAVLFAPVPMPVHALKADCFGPAFVFTFSRNKSNQVSFTAPGFVASITLASSDGPYFTMAVDGTTFSYSVEDNSGTVLVNGSQVRLRCVQAVEY